MAAFVDTNIFFYAFADTSEQSIDKSAIAKALITDLTDRNELALSAQVLSEFAANALSKAKPPLTATQSLDTPRIIKPGTRQNPPATGLCLPKAPQQPKLLRFEDFENYLIYFQDFESMVRT